jgi:hypothetical protein
MLDLRLVLELRLNDRATLSRKNGFEGPDKELVCNAVASSGKGPTGAGCIFRLHLFDPVLFLTSARPQWKFRCGLLH